MSVSSNSRNTARLSDDARRQALMKRIERDYPDICLEIKMAQKAGNLDGPRLQQIYAKIREREALKKAKTLATQHKDVTKTLDKNIAGLASRVQVTGTPALPDSSFPSMQKRLQEARARSEKATRRLALSASGTIANPAYDGPHKKRTKRDETIATKGEDIDNLTSVLSGLVNVDQESALLTRTRQVSTHTHVDRASAQGFVLNRRMLQQRVHRVAASCGVRHVDKHYYELLDCALQHRVRSVLELLGRVAAHRAQQWAGRPSLRQMVTRDPQHILRRQEALLVEKEGRLQRHGVAMEQQRMENKEREEKEKETKEKEGGGGGGGVTTTTTGGGGAEDEAEKMRRREAEMKALEERRRREAEETNQRALNALHTQQHRAQLGGAGGGAEDGRTGLEKGLDVAMEQIKNIDKTMARIPWTENDATWHERVQQAYVTQVLRGARHSHNTLRAVSLKAEVLQQMRMPVQDLARITDLLHRSEAREKLTARRTEVTKEIQLLQGQIQMVEARGLEGGVASTVLGESEDVDNANKEVVITLRDAEFCRVEIGQVPFVRCEVRRARLAGEKRVHSLI